MFTLSAFADEISPDPQMQIDVLRPCGIRHIEFRSILGTNVLSLSDLQIQEFKSLLDPRYALDKRMNFWYLERKRLNALQPVMNI